MPETPTESIAGFAALPTPPDPSKACPLTACAIVPLFIEAALVEVEERHLRFTPSHHEKHVDAPERAYCTRGFVGAFGGRKKGTDLALTSEGGEAAVNRASSS